MNFTSISFDGKINFVLIKKSSYALVTSFYTSAVFDPRIQRWIKSMIAAFKVGKVPYKIHLPHNISSHLQNYNYSSSCYYITDAIKFRYSLVLILMHCNPIDEVEVAVKRRPPVCPQS